MSELKKLKGPGGDGMNDDELLRAIYGRGKRQKGRGCLPPSLEGPDDQSSEAPESNSGDSGKE